MNAQRATAVGLLLSGLAVTLLSAASPALAQLLEVRAAAADLIPEEAAAKVKAINKVTAVEKYLLVRTEPHEVIGVEPSAILRILIQGDRWVTATVEAGRAFKEEDDGKGVAIVGKIYAEDYSFKGRMEGMAGMPARKLADLERRVNRIERSISNFAAPLQAGTPREVDQLREDIARLQEQVYSLSPSSTSLGVSESPETQAHEQTAVSLFSMSARPRSPEASIGASQLERLVAEVVASLAPRYVEEHVSQLYAARKKADEEAQREAEERRAQALRERRLAQLVTDLQTFVPGLMPFQVEEVAQVIGEQWDAVVGIVGKGCVRSGVSRAPMAA